MSTLAATVREVIRRDGADSARSAQGDAYLIGPSEVGGCRAYLAHMVAQTPRDAADDPKWAAFIGSAVGDRLEAAWKAQDPTIRTQVPVTCVYPSGLTISGSADAVGETFVADFKSKDGLELVRRSGPTFQQKAQLQTYLLGLIQAGDLPADATGALIFVDRSGRDDTPIVYEYPLDMSIIETVEARLEDVMYAASYDLDSAPRDQPYDWCSSFCAFFTHCRGKDEHLAAGLITDEAQLAAVKSYQEALAMEKTATRIKDEAKAVLAGVQGRAGDVEVTWSHVGESVIPAYTRAGYDRMSLRKGRTAKANA